MDALDMFEEAGNYFIETLDAVPQEAWTYDSACEGWSNRQVVVHVLNGFALIPMLLAGGKADPATRNADTWGPDIVAEAKKAFPVALATLREPGVLDKNLLSPAGTPQTGTRFVEVRSMDMIVHCWDIRSGAGIDTTLPEHLVQAADDYTPEEFLEAGRKGGGYAAAVEVDAAADRQAKMLAKLGRTPTPTP